MVAIDPRESPFFVENRRRLVLGVGSSLLIGGCDGLQQRESSSANPSLTESQKKWKHKFRGMSGGELYADAAPEKSYVMVFNESGKLFFQKDSMSVRNNSKHSYLASFGAPITLRAIWRDDEETTPGKPSNKVTLNRDNRYVGGVVLGDVTVPVAERIPDELLDKMRKYQAGFILKIRLTDTTLLIGWELRLGKGYPWAKDRNGNSYFRPEVDDTAGGDFCERRIERRPSEEQLPGPHGWKLELPDWELDHKTGKKVYTGY